MLFDSVVVAFSLIPPFPLLNPDLPPRYPSHLSPSPPSSHYLLNNLSSHPHPPPTPGLSSRQSPHILDLSASAAPLRADGHDLCTAQAERVPRHGHGGGAEVPGRGGAVGGVRAPLCAVFPHEATGVFSCYYF